MILHAALDPGYDIRIEPGLLSRAGAYLNLNRRVLIVTDSGVPQVYARTLAAQCARPCLITIPQGEVHKTLDTWGGLLSAMLAAGFTRKDCVAAVGGGVVGDLAGFAAASYMRGVEFYNLPTTVLSQVDSSVGGKTGADLDGVKNAVGAFYQPKAVLIDPDTLKTLPRRQLANGLAEALKMGLTSDPALAALFAEGDPMERYPEILERALRVKLDVVLRDEREAGLRRVLNFGHTLGHGIESAARGELYHGECVALGMLPLCAPEVRAWLIPVLERLGLPTACRVEEAAAFAAVCHDKKTDGEEINVITVPEIGRWEERRLTPATLRPLLAQVIKEEAL